MQKKYKKNYKIFRRISTLFQKYLASQQDAESRMIFLRGCAYSLSQPLNFAL